jgi:hypothetical protein
VGSDEPVLILVYEFQYHSLEHVGEYLSQDFETAIQERNRSEVVDPLWVADFRHQRDERSVDAFQINCTIVEVITESIKIIFDNVPTLLQE